MLFDPKAQISTLLNYKSLPFEESMSCKRLHRSEEVGPTQAVPGRTEPTKRPNRSLAQQVAAIKALDNEDYSGKEDIEKECNIKYKQLLNKYPELLHQAFTDQTPKNGVIHRIKTGSSSPCRAKTRRLIPGSPKEILAKKAWFELVEMGVLEKVDRSTANTWLSPVHFDPKRGRNTSSDRGFPPAQPED